MTVGSWITIRMRRYSAVWKLEIKAHCILHNALKTLSINLADIYSVNKIKEIILLERTHVTNVQIILFLKLTEIYITIKLKGIVNL